MRPALKRFVLDWLGDNPPAEALEALSAALLAEREATIGYIIRVHERPTQELVEATKLAWEMPVGLED